MGPAGDADFASSATEEKAYANDGERGEDSELSIERNERIRTKEELSAPAKKFRTFRSLATDIAGCGQVSEIGERVALSSDAQKYFISRDRIVSFKNVLSVRIPPGTRRLLETTFDVPSIRFG